MAAFFVLLGLGTVQPAFASGEHPILHFEQLVGWSEDGKTWAVIVTGQETHGTPRTALVVYRESTSASGAPEVSVVGSFCSSEQEEDECLGTSVLKLGPGKTITAFQRVDVVATKELAKYRLQPTRPRWQTKFSKDYEVTAATPWGCTLETEEEEGGCTFSWALSRRRNKKHLAVFRFSDPFTGVSSYSFVGGFLHPKGRFALLKFRTGAGNKEWGESTAFRLARLRPGKGLQGAHGDVLAQLTGREKRVLDKFALGHRADDVAQLLSMSPPAVRSHLKSVYRKLGVSSQVEMLRTLGLLEWFGDRCCVRSF